MSFIDRDMETAVLAVLADGPANDVDRMRVMLAVQGIEWDDVVELGNVCNMSVEQTGAALFGLRVGIALERLRHDLPTTP